MMLFWVLLIAVAAANAVVEDDWERFKNVYNKRYSGEEDVYRRSVWEKNLEIVREHNKDYDEGKTSYFLGENQFSDQTLAELRGKLRGLFQQERDLVKESYTGKYKAILPATVDWRKEGYVTSVKDQGDCGSCYAFGIAEALEGQHFKASGKLVALSPSQIVDCSGLWGNTGCGGGEPNWAYNYVIDVKGLDSLANYPYRPFDGVCHYNKTEIAASMTAYKNVTKGSEDSLQKAVATEGPIAAGICAGDKFFAYKGGIFDDEKCSTTYLDHMVLVVGYGSEDKKDFWIVKNSYGEKWGEKGYIRMSRNKQNQCGIASNPSWPIV